MERVLKPIRGVALIGGKQSEETLQNWIGSAAGWELTAAGENHWVRRVRPVLDEPGGWTHAFGDAGHTGCSHDGSLKPPLGIYWYGEPQLGYPAPGALMVDGVFMLCEDSELVARRRRSFSLSSTVALPLNNSSSHEPSSKILRGNYENA
jgi:hypothetical protein